MPGSISKAPRLTRPAGERGQLDLQPATVMLPARWRVWAPLAMTALVLTGCGEPGGDLKPLPPVQTGHYTLGPGDKVRIITFGTRQLTGTFTVSDSGTISVPLLGEVRAAGLTAPQLQDEVIRKLKKSGMYRNPSVAVEVKQYRPIFILGEVKNPGQYPYQPGMTILTAVAIAGGFTYRAVKNTFSVIRTNDDKSLEGRASRDTPLAPGDVITVFERHF